MTKWNGGAPARGAILAEEDDEWAVTDRRDSSSVSGEECSPTMLTSATFSPSGVLTRSDVAAFAAAVGPDAAAQSRERRPS